MDAILAPLERLLDAVALFMVAPEQRLLYVQTSGGLRLPVIATIADREGRGKVPSPTVVLEAPVESGDEGWPTRVEELVEEIAAAAERAAAASPPLHIDPILAPPASGLPIAQFVRALQLAIAAVRAPLEGLTVVLAPLEVTEPAAWAEALRVLIGRPELARARWVVVDPEDGPGRVVAEGLGLRATLVDARMDAAAAQAGLGAMLEGMSSAPPGAGAGRAAGMAGPRQAPPPRPGRPAAASLAERAAAMQAVGLPPAFADVELMQRLRIAVLSAAHAAQKGDGLAAVRHQREARDLCTQAGLGRQSVLMEIILGTYVMQAGPAERSIEVFETAARRGRELGVLDLVAQALLAKAGALLLLRAVENAAVAYAEAGREAAAAPAVPLAVEAYRMSGTLLLQLKMEERAVAAWRRGLEVANAAPPDARHGSSAPDLARALAGVCRHHGLRVQAEALELQATRLEQPPPPPTAAPATDKGAPAPSHAATVPKVSA